MAQYNPRSALADLSMRNRQKAGKTATHQKDMSWDVSKPEILKGREGGKPGLSLAVDFETFTKQAFARDATEPVVNPDLVRFIQESSDKEQRNARKALAWAYAYGSRDTFKTNFMASQVAQYKANVFAKIQGQRLDMTIMDDLSSMPEFSGTCQVARPEDNLTATEMLKKMDEVVKSFSKPTPIPTYDPPKVKEPEGEWLPEWGYGSDMTDTAAFKAAIRKAAKVLPGFMARVGAEAIAVTGTSGLAGAFALRMLLEQPIPIIVVNKARSHGSAISVTDAPSRIHKYVFFDDFVASGNTMKTVEDKLPKMECVGVYEYCDKARCPTSKTKNRQGTRVPYCYKE